MAPYFANQSCDPFVPRSGQCVIGTYAQYSVNVSTPAQVSEALRFADTWNIRLVIKNTGHDYNGKSTGAGSLSLWMHNLQYTEIIPDYRSPGYNGKALKVGAGVQVEKAYNVASTIQHTVVGGHQGSIALAGGFTQGAGHSPLTSKFGLAADNVLEYQVVDGRGQLLLASPTQNADLFRALSGGGPGTYAVVLSATVRMYPDMPTSFFNLTLKKGSIPDNDYYAALQIHYELTASLADAGAVIVSYQWPETGFPASFQIGAVTAPNITSNEVRRILQPLTARLDELGAEYTTWSHDFASFVECWKTTKLETAVGRAQLGGRFIPRSVVQKDSLGLTNVFRDIGKQGAFMSMIGLRADQNWTRHVDNAVLPGWRKTLLAIGVATFWSFEAPLSAMEADQHKITYDYMPKIVAITPGSGAYMNEGDFRNPNWKEDYYGDNYDGLLAVKRKYDPRKLFYAVASVGRDDWVEGEDHRLCYK